MRRMGYGSPFLNAETLNSTPTAFAAAANRLDWNVTQDGSLSEYFELVFRRQCNTELGLVDHWSPLAFSAKSFDAVLV